MSSSITDRLRSRVRSAGSAPLLTYYDLDRGERTELSWISFANWVDKTANLLSYELPIEPGDQVQLGLADTHPGHWVTLIWHAAVWQLGATVACEIVADSPVIEVSGPAAEFSSAAEELVACSLHPLGLGFATPLPTGVVDFSLEVRAQPDSFAATQIDPAALAWRDAHRFLTQQDLLAGANTEPARMMVRPTTAWETCQAALITPIVSGGSAVIVVGGDDAQQRRVAESELAIQAESQSPTPYA